MSDIRRSSPTPHRTFNEKRSFEHWYRDNQIYFITARCRGRYPAFTCESAKRVFWDRFEYYTSRHGFVPIITTLLNNHYHTLGYLHLGRELGPMMQKIHGSIAKMVNDLLPTRRTPFWHDARYRDYFDGCIRDEKQFRLAYRYTQTQAQRAGLPAASVQTRVGVDMERALARAVQKRALLWGVRYRRYDAGANRATKVAQPCLGLRAPR